MGNPGSKADASTKNASVTEQADGRAEAPQPLGPWNPGLTSTLPRRLYPLATIFNPQNTTMTVSEIEDLARFSGLAMQELAELKPERLVLHSVLVRVMTELAIDDGPEQSDLGANFRRIVSLIIERHVEPRSADLRGVFQHAREELETVLGKEAMRLDAKPPASVRSSEPPREQTGWFARLWPQTSISTVGITASADTADFEMRTLDAWHRRSVSVEPRAERTAYWALHRAGSAIQSRQGSICGRGRILHRIATALASNAYGARRVGDALTPIFFAAVEAEGFRRLPAQDRPVVMNTKGASASGKSTLRPRQHLLAERIGSKWRDFAIISPDIWRKQLLDYSSLGAARRWAGTLTAFEVEIIDRKLDWYVTAQARAGRRTHMLIDRFRFDSFAAEGAEDHATQLLTRFGSEVYMYFMVTPPEATVERAWLRGEKVGRYKAVDDLLAHNVEAYTGIPGLFFRWATSTDKSVHFEFLDNSVPEGETPRTIACGYNGRMVVTDVDKLLDVDRYKSINVAAEGPSEVYAVPAGGRREDHLQFLRDSIRKIPNVIFASFESGDIYAVFENGLLTRWNDEVFARSVIDPDARTFFLGLAERAAARGVASTHERVDASQFRTLGAWCTGTTSRS